MTNDEMLSRISHLVADGEQDQAIEAVDEAIKMGIPLLDILNKGGTEGMNIVNERYDSGDAYLPELVIAGDTMTSVVEKIFSLMDSREERVGTVVIGQAEGDVHDIGKNVVAAMLRVNGFEVHDLGTDVSVKKFVEKGLEVQADILAMSTLMTASMPYMEDLPKYLRDIGRSEDFLYIVGGGPVTPEFAQRIGANGWGRSAFDAVKICKRLIANAKGGNHDFLVVDVAAGLQ